MYIDADTIKSVAAVVTALITFFGIVFAVYRWYLRRNADSKEIEKLKVKQQEDIEKLKEKQQEDVKDIQAEQCLIIFGVLACLKGLKEQGCNGPVTKAIDKIERHINLQAHDQEE